MGDIFDRRPYTKQEFKDTFKVGNVIRGWAENVTVEITAIGFERFLYIEEYDETEKVASMELKHGWQFIRHGIKK